MSPIGANSNIGLFPASLPVITDSNIILPSGDVTGSNNAILLLNLCQAFLKYLKLSFSTTERLLKNSE